MKTLGAGVSKLKGSDNPFYNFAGVRVTPELVNLLHKHPKHVEEANPSPPGAINMSTFTQFVRVLGIITQFLRTQSYPAFATIDSVEGTDGTYAEKDGLLKRVAKQSDGSNKRIRIDGDADDDMDGDQEDEEPNYEWKFGSGDEAVPKAKPSTPPALLYGSPSDLPAFPGLIFPYFPQILEHDTNFVAEVIREHFLLCLGEEKDSIIAAHRKLKGALGAIAQTGTGDILQHLACGVRLAIMAQARLFPFLSNGIYVGFALLGAGYSLSLDGYSHEPIEYSELAKKAASIDEHRVAIKEIVMRMAKMKLISTGKAPSKIWAQDAVDRAATNPRHLIEAFRSMKVDDTAAVEIEKFASKLIYPQKFLDFTVENILYAIDLLVSGEMPPTDKPCWPKGGVITSKGNKLSVFAMFGDQGFSFRTPGGKSTAIPETFDQDTLFQPYKGKQGKEVVPNPQIILAKRVLSICVSDWDELLIAKACLMKQNRDAAFRTIAFAGKIAKPFWKGVIDRLGPLMKREHGRSFAADGVELGENAVLLDDDSFGLDDLL